MSLEGTLGWSFSNPTALTVTSLGAWDQLGNGLLESYAVGIWNDATGALLVSGMVPVDTAAPLAVSSDTDIAAGSGFRFTSVTNTLLASGTYVIGAT